MRRTAAYLASVLALLASAGDSFALEFDQKAREMGLAGIAWDGVFTVYATDDALAKETLARIQESYNTILAQLRQRRLRKRCLVFVWKERHRFILQAQTFAPRHNVAHVGAFVTRNFWKEYDALFTYGADDLYERILPHELAHLLLPIFLNPTKGVSVPLWLNEGFAQFQEEDSLEEAASTVAAAMKDGTLFPLRELVAMETYPPKHERNRVFYDQSELLTKFLIDNQKGERGFFDFTYALSCGNKGFAAALKTSYPQWAELSDFSRASRLYLEKLATDFPAERYQDAYRAQQDAGRARHQGDREKAIAEYTKALEEYEAIAEHFPGFSPPALAKRRKECREAIMDACGVKESIDIAVGYPKRRVTDTLGPPQSEDVESLGYPGLSIMLGEEGTVASIEMEEPCDRMVNGVRIGDPLSRVELLHGVRSKKRQAALTNALLNRLEIVSLDKLEPGTYPVASKGKFLGQVVKLDHDDRAHFIAPMGTGDAFEEITFDGDTVERIELYEADDAGADEEEAADAGASIAIGDSEDRLTRLLGAPIEREAKLFFEKKGRGKHRKSTITDKLKAYQLLYPGLYIVTSRGSVIYIMAKNPFKGRVDGIAIGDTREAVRKRLGRRDTARKKRYLYRKMGAKVVYIVSMKGDRVEQINAYRKEIAGGRLSFD